MDSTEIPAGHHRHINKNGSPGGLVHDTATVGEWARVGEWATVGEGARVEPGRHLHGNHGGYAWDLYIGVDGGPVLRYGCEVHDLAWWETADLPALSVRHGCGANHARWTRLVVALARVQWDAIAADVAAERAATVPA